MLRICTLLGLSAVLINLAAEVAPPVGVPAPAPTPGQGPAGPASSSPFAGMEMLLIMGGVIVLMLWFSSRTQKKEAKRRQELLDSMKVDHEVVTIGGLHGTIVAVSEGTVDVRLGKGKDAPVVTVNRAAIATNTSAEKSAVDAAAAAKGK